MLCHLVVFQRLFFLFFYFFLSFHLLHLFFFFFSFLSNRSSVWLERARQSFFPALFFFRQEKRERRVKKKKEKEEEKKSLPLFSVRPRVNAIGLRDGPNHGLGRRVFEGPRRRGKKQGTDRHREKKRSRAGTRKGIRKKKPADRRFKKHSATTSLPCLSSAFFSCSKIWPFDLAPGSRNSDLWLWRSFCTHIYGCESAEEQKMGRNWFQNRQCRFGHLAQTTKKFHSVQPPENRRRAKGRKQHRYTMMTPKRPCQESIKGKKKRKTGKNQALVGL